MIGDFFKRVIKHEYLLIGIILFVGICIFLYKPIFTSATLIPFDVGEEFDQLSKYYSSPSHNYLLSDVIHQFVPFRSFLRTEIFAGHFPFINPYQGRGMPFFEDPQNRIFEFTRFLLLPFRFSLENEALLMAILTLLVAGIGTYGFLRSLRVSQLPALFGALAFMFSGPMMVWLQYPLASAAMWLPFILWMVNLIMKSSSLRALPFFALGITFLGFSGQPQMLVICGIIIALYIIFCFLNIRPLAWRRIFLIFLAGLLGLSISAIQLVPALSYIAQSNVYDYGRGIQRNHGIVEETKIQFANFTSNIKLLAKRAVIYGAPLVYPNIYGSPLKRDFTFPEGNRIMNYSEIANYVGIGAFLFALVSLLLLRKRRIRFWWCITVFAFGFSASLPFLNLFGYLPVLNKINFGRFRFILVLSIIILGAFGLDYILQKLSKRVSYFVAAACIIIVFVDLFLTFSNYNVGNPIGSAVSSHPFVRYLQQQTPYNSFVAIGDQGGTFRSPLVPNTATLLRIVDIRVSDPLRLSSYDELAKIILNVKSGYVLKDDTENLDELAKLGVRFVICSGDRCSLLERQHNLSLIGEYKSDKLYEFISSRPFAYLTDSENTDGRGHIQTIVPFDYSFSYIKFDIQNNAPAYLVINMVYAPGWRALVNGKEQPIQNTNGNITVPLGSGGHHIELIYRPKLWTLSWIISLAALIFLIIGSIWVYRYRFNNKCQPSLSR